MDDYISRQAAIDALNDEYHGMISDESMKIYQIIKWLEELPSAQPERKKGKWKVQTIKGKDIVYCSECGFGVHGGETRRYRYCPNCGAEMIGGRE